MTFFQIIDDILCESHIANNESPGSPVTVLTNRKGRVNVIQPTCVGCKHGLELSNITLSISFFLLWSLPRFTVIPSMISLLYPNRASSVTVWNARIIWGTLLPFDKTKHKTDLLKPLRNFPILQPFSSKGLFILQNTKEQKKCSS